MGFNLYDSRTKIMKYDNESQLLGKDADGKLYYREGMDLVENFKPQTVNLRLQGINKYLEFTKQEKLKM